MSVSTSKEPARIAGMFDAIARRYDSLNHILSAGLDHPDDSPVHEQQVVRPPVTRCHEHLTDGNALVVHEVNVLAIADMPPGAPKLYVDQDACLCFGGEVLVGHRSKVIGGTVR